MYDCCERAILTTYTNRSLSSNADDLLQHPCLPVLEREMDVIHTCGYINFLRTGAPPQPQTAGPQRGQSTTTNAGQKQPTAEEKAKQSEISDFLEDLKELGIGEPKLNAATTTTTTTTEQSLSMSQDTSNKGQELQQNRTGVDVKSHSDVTDREGHGSGEAGGGDDGLYCLESLTPSQRQLLEEWVPLELSFGIPLFSDDANKTVCEKVYTL